MADGVDAAIQDVEASAFEAVLDHPAAQPEIVKLPARDHSVLPPRQRRYRGIRAMRCIFATTVGVDVKRIRHVLIVAANV
jgi:hypothetical protein